MAQFRINSRVAIEEICLDSTPKPNGGQRRITLQLAGWESGSPPDITAGAGTFARVTDASHNAKSKLSTFTIEAVKGAKGVAYIFDRKSPNKDGAMLRLTVGEVTNHDSFKHDLVAELLGRSEDPIKLWVYRRILDAKNNETAVPRKDWDRLLADQPLKQITDPDHPNKWNCGASLNTFGQSYFGKDHYRFVGTQYYKPFKPTPGSTQNKQADIQFDDELLRRGAEKIRDLLQRQIAVTVFVVHHDGFLVKNGVIQQTGHTHFLTIVGCDSAAKKFLVTDPWPGGSRLMYTSGILGTVDTAFMSVLEKFQGSVATSAAASRGAHNYTVLTGPS